MPWTPIGQILPEILRALPGPGERQAQPAPAALPPSPPVSPAPPSLPPIPGHTYTLREIIQQRVSVSRGVSGEGVRGRTPRGGTKGTPLPELARPLVALWLRCPLCGCGRTVVWYLDKCPDYQDCGKCGSVVATGAWLVDHAQEPRGYLSRPWLPYNPPQEVGR